MKELKFKFWNSESKEHLNPSSCRIDGSGSVYVDGLMSPSVKPRLYTGMIDINGKGIYEGDIVRQYNHNADSDVIGPVSMCELNMRWKVGEIEQLYRYHNPEIFGNIYEDSDFKLN